MFAYNQTDVLYFTSLILCITLGSYYKKIRDLDMKRNYGTGLGILIVYVICGTHIYHSVLIIWGNIIIIKCCDKRYIHQISLSYTWTYLIYMHIVFEQSDSLSYVLWIHQNIALRLVGMAFEIASNEKSKDITVEPGGGGGVSARPPNKNDGSVPDDPNAVEIISYAYFFVGLHKGPFYRWKIFHDYFNTPFGILGDCRVITEQKLKKAAAYTLLYIVLRSNFPIETYFKDNFYLHYGADSRYLYNVPHLVMFGLQHQIIMLLCSSICTEVGFGIYPAKCLPLPGHGPSARLSFLNLAATNNDVALGVEYNFAVLRSFEFDKLVFGPTLRDTVKGWNMPTRYWFYAYPYKDLFAARKEARVILTYLVWIAWSGPSLQAFILASTVYVHVHLEKEYGALRNPDESMKMIWDIGYSIARLLCLTYLTPCLIIGDTVVVLKYYNSIFWVYHILLVVWIAALLIFHKMRSRHRTPPPSNLPQKLPKTVNIPANDTAPVISNLPATSAPVSSNECENIPESGKSETPKLPENVNVPDNSNAPLIREVLENIDLPMNNPEASKNIKNIRQTVNSSQNVKVPESDILPTKSNTSEVQKGN